MKYRRQIADTVMADIETIDYKHCFNSENELLDK